MISLRSGSAPGGRCGSRSFQVRTDGNHVRWTCRARGRAGGAGMAVSVWAGNRSSRPARRGTAAMVGSRRSRWQTISSTTGAAGASHRPHRPGGVAGGTAPRRRLVIFRQAVGHCAPSPSDRSLPGQTACSVRQGTRAPVPWYDHGSSWRRPEGMLLRLFRIVPEPRDVPQSCLHHVFGGFLQSCLVGRGESHHYCRRVLPTKVTGRPHLGRPVSVLSPGG